MNRIKELRIKKDLTQVFGYSYFSGAIRVKKDIEVTIPAGINNGQQIRVPGKGERGLNGGPNGDVYIEFTDNKKMR